MSHTHHASSHMGGSYMYARGNVSCCKLLLVCSIFVKMVCWFTMKLNVQQANTLFSLVCLSCEGKTTLLRKTPAAKIATHFLFCLFWFLFDGASWMSFLSTITTSPPLWPDYSAPVNAFASVQRRAFCFYLHLAWVGGGLTSASHKAMTIQWREK